jgi:Mycothiol maleylpyruvate isomerase N-terminal domain
MTNEYPLQKPADSGPQTPADVLHRIDDLYPQLLSTLEDSAQADPSQPRLTGDWSATDVVAHLGRWESAALEAINGQRAGAGRGRVEDYSDYQIWNERWAREDKGLSWDSARERWRRSHQELRELLGELKMGEWDDFVRGWADASTYGHYEEHLSALGYASGEIGQMA